VEIGRCIFAIEGHRGSEIDQWAGCVTRPMTTYHDVFRLQHYEILFTANMFVDAVPSDCLSERSLLVLPVIELHVGRKDYGHMMLV
jgi:hypothetical protein